MRSPVKKVVISGLLGAGVLAGAVSAYAYFTATGSGTGSTTVGSATNWSVTGTGGTGSPSNSGGPMYPGAGSVTVSYGVKNVGGGTQKFTSAVVSVSADSNGYVLNTANSNLAVTGCLATWFSVDNTNAATDSSGVAAGSSVNGSAAVSLTNASVSQDACQGVSPQVTVSVS